ncbi:MAG: hypothetical protein K0S30_2366 [Clostridia bacterium]|jgi:CDP-diglyceride synthetase|nr:hypothetical protein [Clostridia bacterium]
MQTESYGIMLIPVILGIVEVLKNIGLPQRFCPIAALGLGVLLGTIYLSEGDYKRGILMGIYMGLSSVGMYSGAKNIIKK